MNEKDWKIKQKEDLDNEAKRIAKTHGFADNSNTDVHNNHTENNNGNQNDKNNDKNNGDKRQQ